MGCLLGEREGAKGRMIQSPAGNRGLGWPQSRCSRLLTAISLLLLSCAEVPRLDSSIGAPKTESYVDVRDARDWRNPFLVVAREGVRLKLQGQPDRLVTVSDLNQTLASLPVSFWPYGRVVAISEISLRSPDDDRAIAEHLTRTLEVLRAMGIMANRWPS